MITGNKIENRTVYICEGCKEEWIEPLAAEACEKSHHEKMCEHHNCSFTGAINGRMILVNRTCLKCGYSSTRQREFEAMDFWPLLKDVL